MFVNLQMEEVIDECCNFGLKYNNIGRILHERYNVLTSVGHLKRILQRMGLQRRKNYSNPDDVIDFISSQLVGSGSLHGYRYYDYNCRIFLKIYKLVAFSEVVFNIQNPFIITQTLAM
jgi:hypothetical protein